LKAWKLLTLCAAISLLALSVTVFLAAGITCTTYTYTYHYHDIFPKSGDPGDCVQHGPFINELQIKPGIDSSNNTWPLSAGYMPYPSGTPVYVFLNSPGWGPTSPAGSWYAVFGNENPQYGADVNDKVYVAASHPLPG
jgi:hypothetical protein